MIILHLQLAAFQMRSSHLRTISLQFCTELLFYFFPIDTPLGAEGGHDVFVVAGRRVQMFRLEGPPPSFYGADILFQRRNVPFPAFSVE